MEQRFCQILLLEAAFSQEDSSTEDENVTKKRKRALKSGRDSTGATSVRKRITCPHEVIYRGERQPATYKDLMVSSFLVVLKGVQDTQVKEHIMVHLEELMETQIAIAVQRLV